MLSRDAQWIIGDHSRRGRCVERPDGRPAQRPRRAPHRCPPSGRPPSSRRSRVREGRSAARHAGAVAPAHPAGRLRHNPDHLRVLLAASATRPCRAASIFARESLFPSCSGGPFSSGHGVPVPFRMTSRDDLAESGRPPGAPRGPQCSEHLKRTCAPAVQPPMDAPWGVCVVERQYRDRQASGRARSILQRGGSN